MKTARLIAIIIVVIFAVIGVVFSGVFVGMQFGLFDVRGSISSRNAFFEKPVTVNPCIEAGQTVCAWQDTPEWRVIEIGLQKDAAVIQKVSNETGVPARVLAAVVVPEQIRFFT